MRYEYDIVYLSGGTDADRETLNRLGDDGWQLVSVQNGWAYLGREKKETTKRTPAKTKVKVTAEGEVKPKTTRKRAKKAAK